jgi:hypothetical protein
LVVSAPYSVVFFRFALPGNDIQPGPVVPAGVTWVVRDIQAGNYTILPTLYDWDIAIVSGASAFALWGDTQLDHSGMYTFHWSGRQVMYPGEGFSLENETLANAVNLAVSGYVLQGVTLPE